MKQIISSDLFNSYLQSFSSTLRRTYYKYIPQNTDELRIVSIDTELDDDDGTPRASMDGSQIKDTKEKNPYFHTGILNRSLTKLCVVDRNNDFCGQISKCYFCFCLI